MPELPEVETIARYLRSGTPEAPAIVEREIVGSQLLWARTLAIPSPEEFHRRVQGQTIERVGRRGKFLLLGLTQDTLLFHLRMSGDMFVRPGGSILAPHDRLVLELSGSLQLAFNDARKFGRSWLVADPQQVLNSLGPEPLDPSFTAGEFYERLHARRRQLKPLLLDQSFLAGLGNIYSDEALHLAKIHPLSLSDQISYPQAERLLESIRQVLMTGIKAGGSSIDWVYRGGGYQDQFRVYQQTGKTCPVCGTTIVRIVVGQRSTHFCPVCQPIPIAR